VTAATSRDEITKGDLIGGKFRVERQLGKGGMGIVFEATNTQLDQTVALKLLARGADDPVIIERFTREAKAAARLKSEHVARVFDVGKDPVHGPFIVMEMLDGKTLAETLVQSGRIPVHRAVEYVIDACEGLAEAHARGIIHQDVKPGNLFLVMSDDGKPSVKLLDFGIATMRTKEENQQDSKSSAPRSQGTPAYLSPEQLRGHAIDHRADVWSLGCVLYEILCGERAFKAQRFTELVTKILETVPDPLPPALDIPPTLAQVIARCLEKDPKKRFSSTGELAIALLPFAKRRAHSSVAKAVAHVKTSGLDANLKMPSTMPPPPLDATPRPTPMPDAESGKNRLFLYVACAIAVIGLSAAAYALTRPKQSPIPTPPVPTPSASVVAMPTASALAFPSAEIPATSASQIAAPIESVPVKIDPPHPHVPRPAPAPKTAPTPTTTEGEIRHTR
jgi:serine/threonine-protein kinase